MGDLQLSVALPGLRGGPREGGDRAEGLCLDALLRVLHVLPPAPAGGWPFCEDVRAGHAPVCSAEAHLGSSHSGLVCERPLYRGRLESFKWVSS